MHLYKKISARRYIALTQSDCSIEHYIALLKFSSVFQLEAQLMLTTGSTRLAVSRGQQTWYYSTCNI